MVSLHCPLTESNREMINANTLANSKPGAILVNTARGGLINEAALADALQSGKLHWAALDSFSAEPLTAPHRWQDISNVILSPHIGGVSDASYIRMGTVAAQNILQALADTPLEEGVSP